MRTIARYLSVGVAPVFRGQLLVRLRSEPIFRIVVFRSWGNLTFHEASLNKLGWNDMIKYIELQDGEQYADRYLV